jgi:S1-C subfamily serine protease
MRHWMLLPALLLGLALGEAVAQSSPMGDSVLTVGLLLIQPTRLPQSLEKFEGEAVFLPVAYGTGFVVSEDGYVVTALHVIRLAESRRYEIQASSKRMVVCLNMPAQLYECKEVKVIGINEPDDLAVLKIIPLKGAEKLRALQLTSEKPKEGTEVWAAGYPGEKHGTLVVASGTFSNQGMSDDALVKDDPATHDEKLWFARMMVENGASGGPVYLRNGSVIGVIVNRSKEQAVTGFVPAQHVIDLLARTGVTNHPTDDPRKVVAPTPQN